MKLFVDMETEPRDPKSLTDIVGNTIGRVQLSEQKKDSQGFGRKTVIACAATMALLMGGQFASQNYQGNKAHYDSRLTQAIQEHIMERMPVNPITAYMQDNNYE